MQDYLQPKSVECAVCGQIFDASKRNRGKGIHRYCGKACRQRADNARHYRRRRPVRTQTELTRRCVICGVGFVADIHHPAALACSVKCNQARMDSLRRRERAKNTNLSERACEECGSLYTPHPISAQKQRFCSKRCQNRVMQRRHKRTPDKHRRLKTVEWRNASAAAKDRDSGKCRLCGNEAKRLSVHHIFNRTEEEMHDHALENLLSLCGSCHYKIHDIRVGRNNGEIVLSGAIFEFLDADYVKIERK